MSEACTCGSTSWTYMGNWPNANGVRYEGYKCTACGNIKRVPA